MVENSRINWHEITVHVTIVGTAVASVTVILIFINSENDDLREDIRIANSSVEDFREEVGEGIRNTNSNIADLREEIREDIRIVNFGIENLRNEVSEDIRNIGMKIADLRSEMHENNSETMEQLNVLRGDVSKLSERTARLERKIGLGMAARPYVQASNWFGDFGTGNAALEIITSGRPLPENGWNFDSGAVIVDN